MDSRRFDAWSRAAGRAPTRREVARLLGALALGGASLGRGTAEAAWCLQGGERCATDGGPCCVGRCRLRPGEGRGVCPNCVKAKRCGRPSTCGPSGDGACFQVANGGTACFAGEFMCGDYSGCGSSRNCPSGSECAVTCCGYQCVPLFGTEISRSATSAAGPKRHRRTSSR